MSFTFPSSSFFESSGNAAFQFQEDLRDAIVTHACSIWASYPKFFTQGKNPVSSFARGYMNSVCSPIQPPPVLSPPSFSGGQCDGVSYKIVASCQVELWVWTNFQLAQQGLVYPSVDTSQLSPAIVGAIQSVRWIFPPPCPTVDPDQVNCTYGGYRAYLEVQDSVGIKTYQATLYDTAPFTGSTISIGASNFLARDSIALEQFVVSRIDGLPDDCGDLPPSYPPEAPPTQIDLSTTIIVNNNDGVDVTFPLTWNQIDNNYNFPMNVKLGGINVTLSLGGLTIHGNTSITNNNGGGGSPPPGSDGGKDVDGNDYPDVQPDGDYPELPDFTTPNLADETIDFILCESGVIQEITRTVKLLPGTPPLVSILVDMLSNIIEDVCQERSDIGLPEIFPVLPGADRPVVIIYYKEILAGGKRGASTYVATIPNPSQATIDSLETLAPPPRNLGKYVCSLKLLDGSRIVARGDTESEATSAFEYFLGLTNAALVPANYADQLVLTYQNKLQTHSVQATQIEYYPNGKSFARSPSVLVLLNPPP